MTNNSETDRLPDTPASRAVVRHVVATLAYRAAKVLRDVPPDFPTAAFGAATRRPVAIVAHMADLMAWAITLTRGAYVWEAAGTNEWDTEVARFFGHLATVDAALATDGPFPGSYEQLIQGPLTDALTHVGQLALLRGMAGAPVVPESYARAAIARGRVGQDQPPPGREFSGDASARE